MAQHIISEIVGGLSPNVRDCLTTGALGDLLLDAIAKLPAEVYPERANILAAFRGFTTLADIRVTIVGEDPYPNNNADGLAFSRALEATEAVPQSLRTIVDAAVYQNVAATPIYNLDNWRNNGVLLLNTYLTSEANRTKHVFWHAYTSAILTMLPNSVFMLWGRHAQQFRDPILLSRPDAIIYVTAHPSPLAQNRLAPGDKFANTVQFREVATHIQMPNIWQLCQLVAPVAPEPVAIVPVPVEPVEPVVIEPIVEPVVIEPVVHEPIVPEPIEPIVHEPVVPEPIEPIVPEPIEPIVPEPIEPIVPEPIEPIVPEPIEPIVIGPVVIEPVVIEPVSIEPVAIAPVVIGPESADSVVKYCHNTTAVASGRILAYIPKLDPASNSICVIYKFHTQNTTFLIRDNITYDMAANPRDNIHSRIAEKLLSFEHITSANLLIMLRSAEILTNFPHHISDTTFNIRVYTRIAAIGILLKYPHKLCNWADKRMRAKHSYV